MPIHRGSDQPKLRPTVTGELASQFNQNRCSLSATVSANRYTTTVYFDYSTDPLFNTYTTVTYGTVTSQGQLTYVNLTGLAVATQYYFRCRAVNAIGTTNSGFGFWSTWSLKTYTNTTAGSFSVSVPSITPIGGSAIAPTITEMLIYGGGGGANYGGGGGGGYRLSASHTSSTAGTQNVTGTIGGGGGGGNGGTGTGGAGSGGSSTFTVGSTTWTAGGGTAGQHPGTCGSPSGAGGTVGSGSNPAYGGGGNTYGWYKVCSQTWVCTSFDPKTGNCTGGYWQDNYCYDCAYYAGGGGGGTDAGGASACCQNTSSHVGGAGGAGGGAYGLRGGNGGGGYGTQGNGAAGSVPSGSGSIVGTGGTSFGGGTAGGITFKYYGP